MTSSREEMEKEAYATVEVHVHLNKTTLLIKRPRKSNVICTCWHFIIYLYFDIAAEINMINGKNSNIWNPAITTCRFSQRSKNVT